MRIQRKVFVFLSYNIFQFPDLRSNNRNLPKWPIPTDHTRHLHTGKCKSHKSSRFVVDLLIHIAYHNQPGQRHNAIANNNNNESMH